MSDLVEAVRGALRSVIDPDLHQDLVTLNMIRDLAVADGIASFRLVLTTGACPVKQQLEDQCRAAALTVDGVHTAAITQDVEVPTKRDKSDVLPEVKHVVAVASGKGGVGKSTVTVNLACALAQTGARVGLLDADIYGPSIPTMMGIRKEPFIADRKIVPLERHGVRLISMGFLVEPDAAMIWRGPMLAGALKQFIQDVAWGNLDYLLIDMPPGTGDVQMSISQNIELTGAVVVTTPQVVALDDARRGVTMFEKSETPVFGLVENMASYICPSCGHEEAIFGRDGGKAYAKEHGVNYLGAIPLEPSVRQAGDDGKPVVLAHPESTSAQAFRSLAESVAQRASVSAFAVNSERSLRTEESGQPTPRRG